MITLLKFMNKKKYIQIKLFKFLNFYTNLKKNKLKLKKKICSL